MPFDTIETNKCALCSCAFGFGNLRAMTSRGVAQPGSASALGAEGRKFESCLPDHFSCKPRNICLFGDKKQRAYRCYTLLYHRYDARLERSVAKIPFTIRRGARYHFRRRLCLPNSIDSHIILPLQTSSPADAIRAALLSARFIRARERIKNMGIWQPDHCPPSAPMAQIWGCELRRVGASS
jgi:hypothetical protein